MYSHVGLRLLVFAIHEAYQLAFGWGTVINPIVLSAYILQILWSLVLFSIAVTKLTRFAATRLHSVAGRSA